MQSEDGDIANDDMDAAELFQLDGADDDDGAGDDADDGGSGGDCWGGYDKAPDGSLQPSAEASAAPVISVGPGFVLPPGEPPDNGEGIGGDNSPTSPASSHRVPSPAPSLARAE